MVSKAEKQRRKAMFREELASRKAEGKATEEEIKRLKKEEIKAERRGQERFFTQMAEKIGGVLKKTLEPLTAKTKEAAAPKEEKLVKEEEKAAKAEIKEEKKEGKAAKAEEEAAKEEERAAEAKESYFKSLMKGGSKAPGMGLFLILLGLGIGDIVVKGLMGYRSNFSIIISIFLGLVFWFVGWQIDVGKKIKKYDIMIVVVFIIDVFGSQLPLARLPIGGLADFLLGIKTFIWLILAIVLFFFGFVENVASGKGAPKYAWGILILFIAVGIFFAYPQLTKVYDLQKNTYAAPVKEQVGKILDVAKAQIPAWKEPLYSISCGLTKPTGIEQCVKEKKAEATCKPYQKAGEIDNYEECKQVELGIKTTASGIIDPEQKEPLKLEWVPGKELDGKQKEYYVVGLPIFRSKLKIENPREDRLQIEIECLFVDSTENRNFAGLVSSDEGSNFVVDDKNKEVSVTCSPQETLKKDRKYKVVHKAKLADLTTVSKLQMIFFEKAETYLEEKEIEDIKREFPLAGKSRAAKDLARLNFNMGDKGYIEDQVLVQLDASVENVGGGKLTGVTRAEIDLVPPGVLVDDLTAGEPCSLITTSRGLSISTILILSQKDKKDIQGGLCYLTLGDNLKNPGVLFKVVEFEGYLTYSYEVQKEFFTPVIKIVPSP